MSPANVVDELVNITLKLKCYFIFLYMNLNNESMVIVKYDINI